MTVDYRARTAALADAYRQTMLAGDVQLAGRPERKILQAMVADSVAEIALWVRTRAPGGDDVAEPLEKLLPDLQKGNIVGQGLQKVRSTLISQAKGLVATVLLGKAMPLLLAGVVAFVLGAVGFAQDAGASVGATLIPAVVGGTVVTGALVRAFQAVPAAVNSVGNAAGSLYDSAASVGSTAEGIFKEHALPAITALYSGANLNAGGVPVVGQLRGLGKSIVGGAYLLLAVCGLFFVSGLVHAWNAYNTPAPAPGPSSCITISRDPLPPLITCPR
ncbi:hypothetical protein EV138_1345 [Kribbella voronezhensis]|uniref:Uncharacterized protein n=1 Tax=Kribbella voronezhensis TaxID=2512212 RepID=A0A4R7T8Z3_9ACTN|nr:hypothetical protein [Kribbella voronezhensis]TDU87816.1 hypothetical protein EV138_1345 [Kribbella voronezhensis]